MIHPDVVSEPVWKPLPRLRRSIVPARYLPWLLDASSLTARLVTACSGRFRVEVVAQGWGRPLRNEARALAMRHDAVALIRQVRLRCGEVPWVFARTVIPRTTLTGRARRLAHLGSRSLGAVLFADPNVERGEVEVACIAAGERLYAQASQGLEPVPAAVWGRRSIFRLDQHPLLVCEIFLPTIAEFPR